MPASREVGKNLRVIAWEKRITQTELGNAIGLGNAAVSKKMRGEAPITVDELMKMARLLDVEPGQLLPRLDSNQQPSGYTSSLVGRPVMVHGWGGLDDYRGTIIKTELDGFVPRRGGDPLVLVESAETGARSWFALHLELLEPLELDELAA